VVNVWTPGVFGPSSMWTGACGANSADKIWDLMSKDLGTGYNGYAMVDGPFPGTRWNFNMMGAPINRVVDSSNNNLTAIDEAGALIGGTNNIRFTWDGTRKTAVATSGQVSNATLTPSPSSAKDKCKSRINNNEWIGHDAAVYGPGTYTVYADCPAGNPGCGTGTPINFTVGAGELGIHVLVDYGTLAGNKNIDVVNVWKPKSAFKPSPLWTGACGSTTTKQVWDLMSKSTGTNMNGYAIVDGSLEGSRWNFNIMGVPVKMVSETLDATVSAETDTTAEKAVTKPAGTEVVTGGTTTTKTKKPRRK